MVVACTSTWGMGGLANRVSLLLGRDVLKLVALTPLTQGRKEADLQSDSQLHAKLCERQLHAGKVASVLPAVLQAIVARQKAEAATIHDG